jgi:predicted GNAT superfamily acetyltransferase
MAPKLALMTGKPPPKDVILSANAEHSIALRHLNAHDIVAFVKHAPASHVRIDPVNGNLVYLDGDLRIVARRDENAIVVLTTIKVDELSPPSDGQ